MSTSNDNTQLTKKEKKIRMLTHMANNCNRTGYLFQGVVPFLMEEYNYSRRGVTNMWQKHKAIAMKVYKKKPSPTIAAPNSSIPPTMAPPTSSILPQATTSADKPAKKRPCKTADELKAGIYNDLNKKPPVLVVGGNYVRQRIIQEQQPLLSSPPSPKQQQPQQQSPSKPRKKISQWDHLRRQLLRIQQQHQQQRRRQQQQQRKQWRHRRQQQLRRSTRINQQQSLLPQSPLSPSPPPTKPAPLSATQQVPCESCGFIVTPDVKMAVATLYPIESTACIQCNESKKQIGNELVRNQNLQMLYNSQLKSPQSNIAPKEIQLVVDLHEFIESNMPKHSHAIIALLPKRYLNVKVIEFKKNSSSEQEYKKQMDRIIGSTWNANTDTPHPNIISHDNSCDVTIIKLGQLNNYIAICDASYDKNSVDEFCQHETRENINFGVTGKRPGPAGGFLQLNDRSPHHTKITQNPTSLKLAARSSGVAMPIVYFNNNMTVKTTSWGYKAIKMKRLNSAQKLEEAMELQCYRDILIAEAKSYVTSIACIQGCGIPTRRQKKNFINLNRILNESGSVSDALLRWMTSTGEMRNHQAVATHCDPNRSHEQEIYSVFRRDGCEKKNAYLYLPLENACLEMVCNEQVSICSLSLTPHVPDQTRNTQNFSRVHGPPP